jgi:excisionase family DNA binding protein
MTTLQRRKSELQAALPVLHRPAAAAKASGTTSAWIYQQIRAGNLRAVRLAGRVVRIKHEDLIAFLDGRSKQAKA